MSTHIDVRACPKCGAPRIPTPPGATLPPAECVGLPGKPFHKWWEPNPGPQTRFLASGAKEILYGGAAGGGKSAGLIAIALRWQNVPQFRSIFFRRETTQLKDLLDKANEIFKIAAPKARWNRTENTWHFPSGATSYFRHLEHEGDEGAHDGQEYQYIGFDELTHFTKDMYTKLRARLRSSTPGLPRIMRGTSNPGGKHAEWVFQFWGPWLDPQYDCDTHAPVRADGTPFCPRTSDDGRALPPVPAGETLYVLETREGTRYVRKGTPGATGRVFIPAKLADNPKLTDADPGYEANLLGLDAVRRAQLLDGDWLAKPAAGLVFKRAWFEIVDAAPADAMRVRAWDRAATVPKPGTDPDWTVGLKYSRTPAGVFYIEDVRRMRGTPQAVQAEIKTTAEADATKHGHAGAVTILLAQDPGQAGVVDIDALVRLLAKFDVRAIRETGEKVTRMRPASAQAEAGNIKVVRAAWNEDLFSELEAIPEGSHDDQGDTLSLGHNFLADGPIPIRAPAAARDSRWGHAGRGFG